MPPKSKKRRATASSESAEHTLSPTPITPSRDSWQGWCEVESEPAFFNIILRDIGVRGLKVQEVLGLDDELLAILPKPVHAMIFLFRYREGPKEEHATSCPSNVWFANQVPEFACASVALLNIIMNVPNLDLGHELQRFKDSTQSFHPVCKGGAIASFDFVRNVHNSFARDNDMLNIDTLLKEKHGKLVKKQKLEAATTARTKKAAERAALKAAFEAAKVASSSATSSRLNPVRKARATILPESSLPAEDEGFHFIAYMPIDHQVWKLDGMDPFPKALEDISEGQDWLNIIRTELLTRMLQYQEGQIEFSLMAVIQDPILDDIRQLAENIKALQQTTQRLDEVHATWRGFDPTETNDNTILSPSEEYKVTEQDIKNAAIAGSISEKLKGDCPEDLMQLRQEIITAQASCRATIRDQMQSDNGDAVKAVNRRYDYGSFVNAWLDALADEDALLPLLDKHKK